MANASAETLPFFRYASPGVTTTMERASTHVIATPAQLRLALDGDDVPDERYWTAYDHFMIEREARAMRRDFVSALFAKAWSAFRPSPKV